jgi:hypothetical protein
LIGAIPKLTTTKAKFAAYGSGVSAQQSGDLSENLLGIQETVNLVSFLSAEVLEHLATWTWRYEWQ